MIGIVDYGLGNLVSVAGAVKKLGYTPKITSDVSTLRSADKLILPGVGAFGDGIKNLQDRGLIEPLTKMVMEKNKPILGICLGSQLMANESEEYGQHTGLGWINAKVVKLEPGDIILRLPHVGWNELEQIKNNILFENIPNKSLFYYVHTFCIEVGDEDIIIGICEYGKKFVSAIQIDNIFATQFHPEKSQTHGLMLLKNFLENS